MLDMQMSCQARAHLLCADPVMASARPDRISKAPKIPKAGSILVSSVTGASVIAVMTLSVPFAGAIETDARAVALGVDVLLTPRVDVKT